MTRKQLQKMLVLEGTFYSCVIVGLLITVGNFCLIGVAYVDVYKRQIPRMLKDGVCAIIEKDSYPIPPIFTLMAKKGEIEETMMYNTFNMGLGMVVAVDPADVEKTMEAMKAAGDTPYVVGKIVEGEKGVQLV